MILGTAGHIDHGKTALVRALTGVDTDRLPEEKRRGITIDLGFAPLTLEGVGQVGVVDVPGHEAFVRTMVAGATGVDVALLVIAADAGVMPQTREHLTILGLLGVSQCVVALTKCDLVDDDWLALVTDDVKQALRGGPYADAPVARVSATTGAGIDVLRTQLADALRASAPRMHGDLFRMPVDRVFTVKGTGTVVTGTVWSGTLDRDASVVMMPAGVPVRVRGLQAHGNAVTTVHAGDRAAIALGGVDVGDVHRGMTLVRGEGWRASRVVRADVAMVADAGITLGPRSRVRFHLGTHETGARIVVRDTPLGLHPAAVRVVLDAPVVARAGDRFVLRSASPSVTIGGGVVSDPHAPIRARPWARPGASAVELLGFVLEDAGAAGVIRDDLPVRLGLSAPNLDRVISSCGAWPVGNTLLAASRRDSLLAKARAEVEGFHGAHPLEAGAPTQWLRSRLGAPDHVATAIIGEAVSRGVLTQQAGAVTLANFRPLLGVAQEALKNRILAAVVTAATEPPSLDEIAVSLGAPLVEVTTLSRWLAREGALVPVESDRYYSVEAVQELRGRLRRGMPEAREYAPAELKDVMHLTRKFLIPFLEYCDREGYTIRGGLGRRLGMHLPGSSRVP